MNQTIQGLRIVLMGLLLCCASWLSAQTTQDVVYLKNGSIIRGQVIEYQSAGKIKIQITGGSVLVYESSEVEKMEKETVNAQTAPVQNNKPPEPKEKHTFERGTYVMLGLTSIGASPGGIPLPGIAGDVIMGWRLNPYFQAGGGLTLHVALSQSLLQAHGHFRFNILGKRSFSPYIDGQVGYGLLLTPNAIANDFTFNFMDGVQSVEYARGGFYARPAVGVRFASKNTVHCFLDIGVTIQDTYYKGMTWNQFPFEERRLLLRTSIRVGMVF